MILLYGRGTNCPYCDQAKEMLDAMGAKYKVLDLSQMFLNYGTNIPGRHVPMFLIDRTTDMVYTGEDHGYFTEAQLERIMAGAKSVDE